MILLREINGLIEIILKMNTIPQKLYISIVITRWQLRAPTQWWVRWILCLQRWHIIRAWVSFPAIPLLTLISTFWSSFLIMTWKTSWRWLMIWAPSRTERPVSSRLLDSNRLSLSHCAHLGNEQVDARFPLFL